MPVKPWSAPMTTQLAARVTSDLRIMMGRAVIKGTCILVQPILRHIAAGDREPQILAAHPRLTTNDIRAAGANR